MIKDPILLPGDTPSWEAAEEFCLKTGERFIRTVYPFLENGHSLNGANLALYYFDIDCSMNFYIALPSFYIKGHSDYTTKEMFVDRMKELYPEHLEWLLFHQEWL